MIRRRRRRSQEAHFSFDSFLDVVANVVGIIIKLILVVWVGARAYHLVQSMPPDEPPAEVAEAEPEDYEPDPTLDEERRRLAEAELRLLAALRDLADAGRSREEVETTLTREAQRQAALGQEVDRLRTEQDRQRAAASAASLPVEELRQRCRKLEEEVAALDKQPVARKALRYRTPVSRPLDAEELMFECRTGRVTFFDAAALLEEVKRTMRDKTEALKTTWEVDDVAGPVGAFRLRYTVARERGAIDGGVPDGRANFSYGVSSWQAEGVDSARGETLEAALKPGSEFRQIVDGIDKGHAAVTFWVYPDSFGLFRRLRDHLYERDLVVAGRPLPDGAPIAASRRGTASRGQ